MKTHTNGGVAENAPIHGHRVGDRFSTQPQFPRTSLHNRSNPKIEKTLARPRKTGCALIPVSTVWVNRIGKRVVGMARLVQDGSHSARIVLFRIDPEWRHTHVTLNLINSIQKYCQDHGQLNVFLPPHVAPTWILSIMNQHGFQFVGNKT